MTKLQQRRRISKLTLKYLSVYVPLLVFIVVLCCFSEIHRKCIYTPFLLYIYQKWIYITFIIFRWTRVLMFTQWCGLYAWFWFYPSKDTLIWLWIFVTVDYLINFVISNTPLYRIFYHNWIYIVIHFQALLCRIRPLVQSWCGNNRLYWRVTWNGNLWNLEWMDDWISFAHPQNHYFLIGWQQQLSV